jgi:hypothetical protein
MTVFNIWDLERVNIRPNVDFLNEINKKILFKFKTKRKIYEFIFRNNEISFDTFKDLLKQSHIKNYFVPIKPYLEIMGVLGVSKELLQKNIVEYKTAKGVNVIENPKLPIEINPVFDMLFAHHVADGTVVNPKKGRLPYFAYRQFNEDYRMDYIKKIEYVFGKIKYRKNYFLKSTQLYCPATLSSLFFKYYDVKMEDFLSERARIPQIIFDKENENLLAVLIAFIIDEGNIDSTQITIHLKNFELIEDLNKICEKLNYKSKITIGKEGSHNYFRLNILREGMKKLYADYISLNKKYSVINLRIKGEKIKNSFAIYDRKIYKTKGNKNIVLEILKKESLSVNQLANRVNMTRQGTRYHVNNLIKEEKIKIIDKSQLNWIYGV